MIQLIRTTSKNADFQNLVRLLDLELRIRDGDENHVFFAQFNKIDGLREVVVAYLNNVAVGCGAVKAYSEQIAEIKRMFVKEEHRGRGLGGKILTELEIRAKELGFAECILETGFKQPEAIALYQRSGYEIIPNYGQYAGVESSVCMKKSLDFFGEKV